MQKIEEEKNRLDEEIIKVMTMIEEKEQENKEQAEKIKEQRRILKENEEKK